MTSDVAYLPPASVQHRHRIGPKPGFWAWLFRRPTRFIVPTDLTMEQMKDAGIAWELAGYGRGAAVSSLTIALQNSSR